MLQLIASLLLGLVGASAAMALIDLCMTVLVGLLKQKLKKKSEVISHI